MTLSDFFDVHQMRGLLRVGDILIPGNGSLPSFSESGCAEDTARVLGALPERDLKDLRLLLTVLSFCPSPVIRLLLWGAKAERFLPDVLGSKLRLILVGLKGLVMLPYYDVPTHPAGFKVELKAALGYDVAIRSARDPHDEVAELVRNANPLTVEVSRRGV